MSRQGSIKSGVKSTAQKEDSARDLYSDHPKGHPVSGAFQSGGRQNNSSLRTITNASHGGDPDVVDELETDSKLKGTHAKYE